LSTLKSEVLHEYGKQFNIGLACISGPQQLMCFVLIYWFEDLNASKTPVEDSLKSSMVSVKPPKFPKSFGSQLELHKKVEDFKRVGPRERKTDVEAFLFNNMNFAEKVEA
jgi:hypothetical protein